MLTRQVVAVAGLITVLGCIPVQNSTPVRAQDETMEPKATKAADQASQSIFEGLIGAIEDDSYTDFHAFGDATMKEHLTKAIFENLVAQVAPRLKSGYTTEHLGSMNKLGFKLHLWKLSFKDGGDDMLCQLSLKDHKVGGFFLN